jgi:hypothetical protein
MLIPTVASTCVEATVFFFNDPTEISKNPPDRAGSFKTHPINPFNRHANFALALNLGFTKPLILVYSQYILDFQVLLKLSKWVGRYLVVWKRERQRGMKS